MKKSDLVLAYLYNLSSREDDLLHDLRLNVLKRSSDEEDYLELIMQKVRVDTINEIVLSVFRLYGL